MPSTVSTLHAVIYTHYVLCVTWRESCLCGGANELNVNDSEAEIHA